VTAQHHTNAAETTTVVPLMIPPIPLVTGTTFTDADGAVHDIADATIVIRAGDGTEKRIPLTFDGNTAWWVRQAL